MDNTSPITPSSPDTICALATAPGGAIGIVRISGAEAINIADRLFTPAGGAPLSDRASHTLTFGTVHDVEGSCIDEVLVSIFRAPHSYTGEDCVEISCHGSAFILNALLDNLVRCGARPARPGEYTQRAFQNGRMDLSQAEAVADLIASRSAQAHHIALRQMRGNYSGELAHLRQQLLRFLSLLELELDFSDHEDLEFADRTELTALARRIEDRLQRLVASYSLGNVLKNGLPVAIVGETNAGKSTLLNALLGEERAIVSNISGTTRDAIEATCTIAGTTFRFVDTAGLRETDDAIERIGIERAIAKLRQAQIVLWVFDVNASADRFRHIYTFLKERMNDAQQLVVLLNKADTLSPEQLHEATRRLSALLPPDTPVLPISARSEADVQALRTHLAAHVPQVGEEDIVVSSVRHKTALSQALAAIRRAEEALAANVSADLVGIDLRECTHHLAEITGDAITDAEVLNSIFSEFCIGK